MNAYVKINHNKFWKRKLKETEPIMTEYHKSENSGDN